MEKLAKSNASYVRFNFKKNCFLNYVFYNLGKKTGQTPKKFWKWIKNVFLCIKFNKKFLCGLSDVLPQFAYRMTLIGMYLSSTLEGYLSSPTSDYWII